MENINVNVQVQRIDTWNFNCKMNIARIFQAEVGVYSQSVRQLQKTKQFRQLL